MERDRYDAKYETSRYEQMIGFEFKGSFIEEQENRDEINRLNHLHMEEMNRKAAAERILDI